MLIRDGEKGGEKGGGREGCIGGGGGGEGHYISIAARQVCKAGSGYLCYRGGGLPNPEAGEHKNQ